MADKKILLSVVICDAVLVVPVDTNKRLYFVTGMRTSQYVLSHKDSLKSSTVQILIAALKLG